MSAIPDYAYLTPQQESTSIHRQLMITSVGDVSTLPESITGIEDPRPTPTSKKCHTSKKVSIPSHNSDVHPPVVVRHKNTDGSLAILGTSVGIPDVSKSFDDNSLTPSKILELLTPVPSLEKKKLCVVRLPVLQKF